MSIFDKLSFRKNKDDAAQPVASSHPRRRFAMAAVATLGIVGVAYGVSSQIFGAPDYRTVFDDVQPPKGKAGAGSKLIAVLPAMISKEVANGWCPAETVIHPSSLRTDTCAFQLGEEEVFSQISTALRSVMTNTGPRSKLDSDLDIAARKMQIDPNNWVPFFGTTAYYDDAISRFEAYNRRLAAGEAELPKRISDVEEVLQVLMRVDGQQQNRLAAYNGNWFLVGAPRAAYDGLKGSFKASCEILKAVKVDFASVISNQSGQEPYENAITSTCAIAKRPTPWLRWPWTIGAQEEALAGAASQAIGDMQFAYDRLSGGPSALRPR